MSMVSLVYARSTAGEKSVDIRKVENDGRN